MRDVGPGASEGLYSSLPGFDDSLAEARESTDFSEEIWGKVAAMKPGHQIKRATVQGLIAAAQWVMLERG